MSHAHKRPRGRAPHDASGRAKLWNHATGAWDEDCAPNEAVEEEVWEEDDAPRSPQIPRHDWVALTADRDAANRKVAELQREIESLREAELKAAEDKKALQLMTLAQRPDLGVNTLGAHPSCRPKWWECVSDEMFTVLNECFQESLIGHRKRGSTLTCAAPQINVFSIEQRFNPAEAAEYNQYLLNNPPVHFPFDFVRYPWQRIATNGDAHNEIFAWHGTAPARQASLEEGFDLRRVRPGKGLFGDGLYFSPHASKSDMYTKPTPSDDMTAIKSIYLVRLNMGRVWDTTTNEKHRRIPPENHDTARAVGGSVAQGHATLNDEYVLYDHRRVQIAFKFTYRHRVACRCAMCSL